MDRELNRIVNDPNASPNDVCRLSNKLAADYLVVAEATFSDVASPGTDFATGLPLPPPSAVFAEVRFRCVVAPTTEIAWADTIRLDASMFGGDANQFSSDSAWAAAEEIRRAVQRRLDPQGFAAFEGRLSAERAEAARRAAEQVPAPAPQRPVDIRMGRIVQSSCDGGKRSHEASAAEAAAKAAPKDMKLMIAGFGTIESMTKVEEWLGEQLHPVQKLDAPPTLSEGRTSG